MKRGEFVWSKLANMILILALLIILIAGIFLLSDYGNEIWEKLVAILRFG